MFHTEITYLGNAVCVVARLTKSHLISFSFLRSSLCEAVVQAINDVSELIICSIVYGVYKIVMAQYYTLLHPGIIISDHPCFTGLCFCELRQNLKSCNEQNIWVWKVFTHCINVNIWNRHMIIPGSGWCIMCPLFVWFAEYMVQKTAKRLCLRRWNPF